MDKLEMEEFKMKKMVYVVSVDYDVLDADGNFLECQVEDFYADTLDSAYAEADKHVVGSIEGDYGDGAVCVVRHVYVNDFPQIVDFV